MTLTAAGACGSGLVPNAVGVDVLVGVVGIWAAGAGDGGSVDRDEAGV